MYYLKSLLLAAVLLFAPMVGLAGGVNINTADADTIAESLTGVGPVKAEAIVEHREQNGAFESAEDLLEVHGIGAGTVDPIRDDIRFSDES